MTMPKGWKDKDIVPQKIPTMHEEGKYRERVLKTLKIFSDEPDEKSKTFNFDIYADQLCNLIVHDIPDTSFAICLNGEWGSGKTSLLRRVYNRLKEKDDRFKVLWFDAWQYERLDPVLALLQKISVLYEKRNDTLKNIMKSLTLVFSDIVLRKTTGLSVDDVQQHFETSVKEIEALTDTLQNIIGKDEKLVVFIDDLDRCTIDNTLDILESIKLLFNAKNTIFVVAADIKKLEIAWELRYQGEPHTLDEGREHLDKIFQLRLSLPPKISFPKISFHMEDIEKEGGVEKVQEYQDSEEEANKLIKEYLEQYLENELPDDLRQLIIKGFPPNPRKIKRALSLAYFIGKNIQDSDINKSKDLFPKGFEDVFPLILIWSVTTLYFPDLAGIIRRSPHLLIDICVIIANTLDIGNLQLKIDKISEAKDTYCGNEEIKKKDMQKFENNEPLDFSELLNKHFSASIIYEIEPAALKFAQEHIVNSASLYRLLKVIVGKYNIRRNPKTKTKNENYKKTINELKIVIESAGLMS